MEIRFSFHLSPYSEGTLSEGEYNVSMIRGARVIFTPGSGLKKAIADIKYIKEE